MLSRERTNLLIYNLVAVLGGALTVFGFMSLGSGSEPAGTRRLKSQAIGRMAPAENAPALSMPVSNRLAFVAEGVVLGLADPSGEAGWKSSVLLDESGQVLPDEGAWSTDVRSEPAPAARGPRLSLVPAMRLPWQTSKPILVPRSVSLQGRLAELGPSANLRLAARFEAAKAPWPPAEVTLIALKDEKVLELYARAAGAPWVRVHRYKVLAASGGAGPKLRQGDRQVPEGIYGISYLNPSSAYHVSLRVNYPNAFDRQMAQKDGRKDLGGDIMIHGKNLSAGCLAMGDEAAEDLFVLAAQTGLSHVKLIIAPTDLREHEMPAAKPDQAAWLPKLYQDIAAAMVDYRAPPKPTGLLSFFAK